MYFVGTIKMSKLSIPDNVKAATSLILLLFHKHAKS